MSKRLLVAAGAVAIGMLGFTASTHAGTIYGSQDKVENGCIAPIPFFVLQDCSYDGSNYQGFYGDFGPQSWIGPMAGENYFLSGESASGEQKRIPVGGDLVITGSGAGASIAGTIDIGAGERISACSQADICTESWDSISHAVPSTGETSAVANSAGGFDYTFSSLGQPVELVPCVGYFFPAGGGLCDWAFGRDGFNFAAQTFPSVTPSIPYAGGAWKSNQLTGCVAPNVCGPLDDTPGLATLEGGFAPFQRNDGIQTTATMVNYSCVPGIIDADCNSNVTFGADQIMDPPGPPKPPGWTEGNPSFENLHLQVSTNGAGTILSINALATQEYSLLSFHPSQPDSWGGHGLDLSGIRSASRGVAGHNDIQIDKKNAMSVVIYGSAGFDVSTIDSDGLEFGPGEFTLAPTTANPNHSGGHIADTDGDGYADLTVHFASNDSDLRCGKRETNLRGTSDGVPFILSIQTNGIGKACDI
jgi:hypothetical protein